MNPAGAAARKTRIPVSGSAPRRLAWLIATCCGLGRSPAAPGTVGSLAALGAAALLVHHHGWGAGGFALLSAVLFLPAVWASQVTAAACGKKDPSLVVVDEALGQWVTLAGAAAYNWKSFLAAFVLFRLLDIFKPPPVRQMERLPGGWGIIADDVAAGLIGALVLLAAGWFNFY